MNRLLKILWVVSRYRLDRLLDRRQLPRVTRALCWFGPWQLFPGRKLSRGAALRRALEELGPVFIKFGQMLSTRIDLLPEDIASELARLQDDVPPFSEQTAVAIVERELGAPLAELFAEFTATPLASASVAQVHAATLHGGARVVVKVLRPGIEEIIRQDLGLLFGVAQLIHRYLPDGYRLRPTEVVADYENTILNELDLQREAANTSQLKRNCAAHGLVHVPEVYWDYSSRRVFVMERIEGIPVTAVDQLQALGTDLKLLAERGVEIFFTQVFKDNFFHADMHPGNILVDASNPADPRYVGIDCAIVGSLSDSDQYYLARNLLAIFQRDYRASAQLHVECGWVPADTRVVEFEAAMRAVCEPVFEKPISEISFGRLLIHLFQTARRFHMEVQPSLVLLQKTLLNIEGMGRQLYPELDLWSTAQPFLEKWMQQRYSPQGMLQRLGRSAPSWLEQLPLLPATIVENLQRDRSQEVLARRQQREWEESQRRRREQRERYRRGAGALLLLAGAATTIWPGHAAYLATLATSLAPWAGWLLLLGGIWLLWPRAGR